VRNGQASSDMDDENLLNADQVAMLLGVNRHWVRDHCTRALPIIPHNKLGRKVRFEREEILRFIRECRESRPKWERNGRAV